ncbi:winged helix-turn-helix transcriptional regulator [Streptosporangium sp. CA-115845]|uniref:winged helix-turn-helix transcriptional regulator n=1 Tax=Streptosporangium sp. CA-115845 TaxID=3240071 RepID=UPI003D8C67F0
MLGRTYDNQNCSAARALEIIGERWSLLIMRDAIFRGHTKFTEFQRQLGIAPNVLASRLESFVAAGLMRTRRYTEHGDLHEYVLTPKGLDLQPVIIALTRWGDRWAAPDGPPVIFRHNACGGHVDQRLSCADCGTSPPPADVRATPGPGLSKTARRETTAS